MKQELTPREIVAQLDKYIVGQNKAKRAVAIALRNRYRRSNLPAELRDEVLPKNILMIGPTGVGKTEIARRLAKLVSAPFIKIEATKFTEVGYVGRDVESMVRDLMETGIRMIKQQKVELVKEKARLLADERILELLIPMRKKEKSMKNPLGMFFSSDWKNEDEEADSEEKVRLVTKQKELRSQLEQGKLEEEIVEIELEEQSPGMLDMFAGNGSEQLGMNMQEMLGQLMPRKTKKRKMTIKEAREILINQEAQKLVDMDQVIQEAVEHVEQSGIIFLDEIDKIAGKSSGSIDVSREGVQRDILPIVEGSTVVTKYGPVKTDHILFVAAGAFHVAKPSDLIPELQGRFPIRVELAELCAEDFIRILTEPRSALLKQYTALLKTEGVAVDFTPEAIAELARLAALVNEQTENIGARRLHTILERLLEDLSFEAPDLNMDSVSITLSYVQEKLSDIVTDLDLSQYIL